MDEKKNQFYQFTKVELRIVKTQVFKYHKNQSCLKVNLKLYVQIEHCLLFSLKRRGQTSNLYKAKWKLMIIIQKIPGIKNCKARCH